MEIIEKQPGESHSKFRRTRQICELEWIKKLQTVYPIGLNDNIMGIGNISRTDSVNIFNIISKKLRNKRSHGRRINHNKRKHRRNNTTVSDLFSISKYNGRHMLLSKLCSLPANKLFDILEQCNNTPYHGLRYETAQIIVSFCYFRLYPKIDSPENHKKHFLKIKYINKGLDYINITGILHDKNTIEQIPGYFDNVDLPMVSYIYKKPSRQYVFNYGKICKDFDIDQKTPSS